MAPEQRDAERHDKADAQLANETAAHREEGADQERGHERTQKRVPDEMHIHGYPVTNLSHCKNGLAMANQLVWWLK